MKQQRGNDEAAGLCYWEWIRCRGAFGSPHSSGILPRGWRENKRRGGAEMWNDWNEPPKKWDKWDTIGLIVQIAVTVVATALFTKILRP